jgi:hypothetical protein
LLSKTVKDAATAAFRDNSKRAGMTPEEREEAAQWYEQIAEQTMGTHAGLARLYNLERAKFLREEVNQIAPTARQFGEEIGYADETPV